MADLPSSEESLEPPELAQSFAFVRGLSEKCQAKLTLKRRARNTENKRQSRARLREASSAVSDAGPVADPDYGLPDDDNPPEEYGDPLEPPEVGDFQPGRGRSTHTADGNGSHQSRADQRDLNVQAIQDVLLLEYLRAKGSQPHNEPPTLTKGVPLPIRKPCCRCGGWEWTLLPTDWFITVIECHRVWELPACNYQCANAHCQHTFGASDPLTYTNTYLLPTAPKTCKTVVMQSAVEVFLTMQQNTPNLTIASFVSASAREVWNDLPLPSRPLDTLLLC